MAWEELMAIRASEPLTRCIPQDTLVRMAKTKTRPYDTANYLKTIDDIAGYLEAVLEGGDPELIAAALGDIARAKGMTQLARATGLGRESLYKALSVNGNPEFATVLKVVRALGMTLRAMPKSELPKKRTRLRTSKIASSVAVRG